MPTPWERPSWKTSNHPAARYTVRPVIRFMRIEAAGGLVLIVGALVGLIWANVWPDAYHDFWLTELSVDLSIVDIHETLEAWVTDALMSLFFFVVALEIKRELAHGELADRRRASLPVAAALGGMIAPALIFTAFNAGGEGSGGWGIPVATDIAFAVGVLALLGRRVPLQLKIFLLALAVADDVGGIAIIAIFYTDNLALDALSYALALLALIWLMPLLGVRSVVAYMVVGVGVWLATFESGIHATISAVVLGLMTPARPWYAWERFEESLQRILGNLRTVPAFDDPEGQAEQSQVALQAIGDLSRESEAPVVRLERALAPWSGFVVVPIFAVANAGIELGNGVLSAAAGSPVAWGVGLGLLVGKTVGITGASFLAVRSGLAALPSGVTWPQIIGVALLGGVGFTVSIFIANLSFDDPQLVSDAKIGIFVASLLAAVLGYLLLRFVSGGGPGVEAESGPVEPVRGEA